MTARVLITDGDQRAALAATRSLGKAGYQVVVVGSAARTLAGASRYARWTEPAPSPAADPTGYQRAIAAIVERHRPALILPITDAALLALLPIRDRLTATIPWPDVATVQAVADKGRVLAAAEGLGIAVPEARRLAAPPVDEAPLADLPFPVVVKPERSVTASAAAMTKHGVIHAADLAELTSVLRQLPADAYPLQVQRRVIGPGTGLFLLLWDGAVVARFAHRRLREKPPSGGVSVYAESIAIDEELADRALALLRHFAWSGVAMVEFKRDRTTGTPYLMEINGRLWGSLQLAIDSGVDFPALLVAKALGRPGPPIGVARVGTRCRWWWGDVDQLLTRLRRSPAELHLPPGTPGLARTALAVLVPGVSRGRNEVCRVGDLRPAIRETIDWFRSL